MLLRVIITVPPYKDRYNLFRLICFQMSNNATASTSINSHSFLPSTATSTTGADVSGFLVGLDESALTANVGGKKLLFFAFCALLSDFFCSI